jgi:polysaccharide deacetylase family protein (PEP-CTERM system associated)
LAGHRKLARVLGPGLDSVPPQKRSLHIALSFDVEDHHQIEAGAHLSIDPSLAAHCRARLEPATHWVLEKLADRGIQATFFVVGEIGHRHPKLVRDICRNGHEVGCHGWDHKSLRRHTRQSFREDLARNKDILEQATGEAVEGYRAPSFSISQHTPWAIDELASLGFLYDSSIYPIRHDRYGMPQAPRTPFRLHGLEQSILELPPATLRFRGMNFPVGGGGYFRLLPTFLVEHALAQARRELRPAVVTLYFHPWEFDRRQLRLPLGLLSQFRTYAGVFRNRARFVSFAKKHLFVRAVDVARCLFSDGDTIPTFEPFMKVYGSR